jgi:hypothetical protein
MKSTILSAITAIGHTRKNKGENDGNRAMIVGTAAYVMNSKWDKMQWLSLMVV